MSTQPRYFVLNNIINFGTSVTQVLEESVTALSAELLLSFSLFFVLFWLIRCCFAAAVVIFVVFVVFVVQAEEFKDSEKLMVFYSECFSLTINVI